MRNHIIPKHNFGLLNCNGITLSGELNMNLVCTKGTIIYNNYYYRCTNHVATYVYILVLPPDHTSKEDMGLGGILGPALRNFHAPMRSQLWLSHMTSLPQECNIAILAVAV